ncbi:MAG TPA: PQQ-binding-like beta-propeller repeat protein, partial [Gemmata sp.]
MSDPQPNKEVWYRIVDLASGQQVCRFEVGKSGKSKPVFSPDGSVLAIGSYDKEIVLWNTKTGAVHNRFKVSSSVWTLAYTPDGTGLFASLEGTLVLLDAATGATKRTFGGPSLHAAALAVSPSGEVLAAVTRSLKKPGTDFVSLWEVATGGQ